MRVYCGNVDDKFNVGKFMNFSFFFYVCMSVLCEIYYYFGVRVHKDKFTTVLLSMSTAIINNQKTHCRTHTHE